MPAASFTITDNPSYLYWDHTPLDLKSEIIPWLGVSSFSWLVDLLLSFIPFTAPLLLDERHPGKGRLVKKGDFHGSDGSLTGVP